MKHSLLSLSAAAGMLLLLPLDPAPAAVDLYDPDPGAHRVSDTAPVAGGTIQVSFLIGNDGDEAAERAEVSFYLSDDDRWQADDPVLARGVSLPRIPARGQVEFAATLTMTQPGGPWYLIWVLEDEADAQLRNNTIVYAKMLTVQPATAFDLSDAGALHRSLGSRDVLPGGSFDMTASVQNVGAASGIFRIRYLLSVNATAGDADDITLSQRNFNSLPEASARLPSVAAIDRTLTVPAEAAPGTYRFGYMIESAADSNQNNNAVLFDGNFAVSAPSPFQFDLRPDEENPSVVVPSVPVDHGPIVVSTRIRNGGPDIAPGFHVEYFASRDSIPGNADDIPLGTREYGPVFPGYHPVQGSGLAIQAALPTHELAVDISYRIGLTIQADGDTNPSNNTFLLPAAGGTVLPGGTFAPRFDPGWTLSEGMEASGSITNQGLREGNYYLYAVFERQGQPFNLNRTYYARIPNSVSANLSWFAHGPGPAATREIRKAVDSPMVLNNAGLGSQVITDGTFEVTLLLSTQYWFGDQKPGDASVLDYQVLGEPYVHGAAPTLPDFAPSLTVGSTAAVAGGPVTLTGVIHNYGVASGAVAVQAYRLQVEGGVTERVALGAFQTPPIAAQGQAAVNYTFSLPGNTPTGAFTLFVGVDPDNSIAERRELNNLATFALTVGASPDLMEGDPAARIAPTEVRPGESLATTMRVRNAGSAAAGPFAVRVFLSAAPQLNEEAVSLGIQSVAGGLGPHQSVDMTLSFPVPAGIADGSYYAIWRLDANNAIIENDETNNTVAFDSPVRVVSLPNLLFAGPVAFSPASRPAGSRIDVEAALSLSGGGPVDRVITRVFLSPDRNPSANDIVLAESEAAKYAPGQNKLSFSAIVPAGTPRGAYFVGCVTDVRDTVPESDETDNVAWSDARLVVEEPPLAPFQPRIVEVARTGADLRLVWTSRSGRSYQLEAGDSPDRWSPLSDPIAGSAVQTSHIFPASAPAPRRFFRIRELPLP